MRGRGGLLDLGLGLIEVLPGCLNAGIIEMGGLGVLKPCEMASVILLLIPLLLGDICPLFSL
jgi:hypothetical protein